jgi:energy-coupling factor transporter ATP-binding protein EcfA2
MPAEPQPFVGLRPFGIDDSPWFFGRNKQTYDVLRRLNSMHFLAVVGPSGCGKSSLIRAGLLASLQDGYLANDGDWRIVAMEPGNAPVAEWKRHLTPLLRAGKTPDDLMTAPAEALDTTGGPVAILVDQFEDLFKYGKRTGKRDEVAAFIHAMLAAAVEDGRVYTVITMRSEFLESCALFPDLAEAINEGLYLLPRMDREQLRQAIVGPVQKAGGAITVEFLDKLLDEGSREEDGLPILQHAMAQIWPRRQRFEPMGVSLFPSVGGLGAYIDDHANQVYRELNTATQTGVEQLFRAITERSPEGRALRRPLTVDQIAAQMGANPDLLERAVAAFCAEGFLWRKPSVGSEAALIDITHEAVARQWKRLAGDPPRAVGWLDQEDRARKAELALCEASREWERSGRRKEYLIVGERLERLKRDLGDRVHRVTEGKVFLKHCEQNSLLDRVLSRKVQLYAMVFLIAWALAYYFKSERTRIEADKTKAEDALKVQQAEAKAAEAQAREAQTELLRSRTKRVIPEVEDAPAQKIVYPQVWSDAQKNIVSNLQVDFRGSGYTIEKPETVSVGPTSDELRYFRKNDLGEANEIAGLLEKSGVKVGKPKLILGFESKLQPHHFELWFKKPTQ